MKFWQVLAYERTENLLPLAQTCEELGFEGVFLSDHLVGHADIESEYPYPYNDGDSNFVAQNEFPECFAAISAMAAITSKLRFSTMIYVAPLRHPVHLAKSIATASALSGGRVALGAGVGWLREEFDAVGEHFGNRGRRLDEMIEVMRKLWTGEMVEHHGEFYEFELMKMLPAPVGRVPIMAGGLHPRMLKRAALLCDGWISPGNTPEELVEIRKTVQGHRDAVGRGHEPFEYIVSEGGPEALEQYVRLGEPGVAVVRQPLSFSMGPDATLDARRDALAKYAKDNIEKYRDTGGGP